MRTALITGGSSGLGLEMAKQLAIQGYEVIIIARNQEKMHQAEAEITALGGTAFGYACDISDEEALAEVARKIKCKKTSIDFLVLNAGITSCGLLEEYTELKALKKVVETDLWGTIACAHFFMPFMGKNSKVLITSSGFGLMGPAGYTVYAAAKAGLINFAEALRREVLHRRISIYVACPGDIDTPQLKEERDNMPVWMKTEQPRGLMQPADAAERILKKCSGGRFLIIINPEIKALLLSGRLLPRWLRDKLIDGMFPLPTPNHPILHLETDDDKIRIE